MRRRARWKFVPEKLEESARPLSNPGRGWYEIHTFRVGETDGYEMGEADVVQDAAEQMRAYQVAGTGFEEGADSLALLLIQIDPGVWEPGGRETRRIERILAAFAGKRDLIVRFAYDLDGKGMEHEPAQFSQVMRHLGQLAPILQKHARSIYLCQGVLVGSWGEMHTSKFVSGRYLRELGAALVEIADGRFFLAVRRPCQWRQIVSETEAGELGVCAVPGTGSRAETGLSGDCGKRGRIGLFNDGILGSATDLGTYGSEPPEVVGWESPWLPGEELSFQQSLCSRVPNGGEAVYGSDSESLTLEQIVNRLSMMRISYLNRRHDQRTLDRWREMKWKKPGIWNGMSGFDYIGGHLGYRFVVRRAGLKRERHADALLTVEIENVGFSPMYEQAELFLTHEDAVGRRQEEVIPCDVTSWGSGGTVCLSHPVVPREGRLYLSMRRAEDQRRILFANRCDGGDGEFVPLGRIMYPSSSSTPFSGR